MADESKRAWHPDWADDATREMRRAAIGLARAAGYPDGDNADFALGSLSAQIPVALRKAYARGLAAAERERAAADALADACCETVTGQDGHRFCWVCGRMDEHTDGCALAAYRAARGER